MFLAIFAFIVILGLLVFVHEAGHFIAARRAGMAVEEFGFGFPPRIIGFQRVRGKWRTVGRVEEWERGTPTMYSLNWIPLGGFVRITGESGSDASDPSSFAAKPRWQRAAVLLAGVAMNAVLGIALFTVTFAVGSTQIIDAPLPPDARVRDRATRVLGVLPGSPAAAAGVASGDAIRGVEGEAPTSVTDLQERIRAQGDREFTLTIARDGQERALRMRTAALSESGKRGIGVQLAEVGTVSYPLPRALVQGVRMTGYVIREILVNLGAIARGLVTADRVPVDIAGPVGIAVMTGQVAQLGFTPLLQFAGMLSVNLALLNAFPFPALDGGRLFLLLIEAIRRRALAARVEQAYHAVGYVALLLLVVAVTYHDIVRFGGGIMASLRSVVGF